MVGGGAPLRLGGGNGGGMKPVGGRNGGKDGGGAFGLKFGGKGGTDPGGLNGATTDIILVISS